MKAPIAQAAAEAASAPGCAFIFAHPGAITHGSANAAGFGWRNGG
jgi:hypothetical protein